jgi:hypothetical protein
MLIAGVLSDHTAQYNYNINLNLALAQERKQLISQQAAPSDGRLAKAEAAYRHVRDFPLAFSANELCLSLGMDPIIPLVNVPELKVCVVK